MSISIQEALDLFLAHRRRKNISIDSLTLYIRLLGDWKKHVEVRGVGELGAVGLDEFTTFLAARTAAGLAPASVAAYRRVLRALWRFLEGEGLLTEEQTRLWANDRIPRPLDTEPEPRPYCDDDTFEQLLDAAGDAADEQSARDRALLLLLWESGARVGELCKLEDAQLDLQQRRASIVGKGRRRGWIFWGPRAGAALLRYLATRRGKRGGPLFRGVSSRNPGGALTPNAVRLMVKRLGVELPKGAPVHFLRHGFAHRAIDEGLELSQVQQLMRHASHETTLRYLKERPDKLQALHQQVLRLRTVRKRGRAEGQ